MKLNLSLETENNTSVVGKNNNLGVIESQKEKGLSFLKKGQKITGKVIAVAEQVILDLCGQKVSASKEMLENSIPGDEKIFEVTKAAGNIIELMLVQDTADREQQSVTTIMRLDKDKDNFLTLQELRNKNAKKEKEINYIKNRMEEVVSKMTEQDYRLLEENGIAVDNLSMEQLCTELDRVKAEQKVQMENPIYLIQSELTQQQIEARLAAENLPVTKETVHKVATAMHLSSTVNQMDDKTVRALIANETEPTIANIYKACYSGETNIQEPSQSLDPQAWEELKDQVEEVIVSAGYELNQENLQDAKWLVENNLPLTKQTYTYKKELEEIKTERTREQILDRIMTQMKQGIAPLDASLHSKQEVSYEQLIADINSIPQETLVQAVQTKEELTIKNLASMAQNAVSEDTQQNTIETDNAIEMTENNELNHIKKDDTFEEIKALRQLEEIRLKMTKEAAARLESKGFHIETEQLEKVVDALREYEDSYYRELLKTADVEVSQTNVQRLKETTQSIEQLKQAPIHILGTTLSSYRTITIADLVMEGNSVQAKFLQAGEAYETRMTVPNGEYGDSIQKAFKNMTSLLSELELEDTQANQRAVRVLGYSQMEINEKNIAKVKVYDLAVTRLVRNLHPAVTVTMIKEGLNPLAMPIQELNQTIDQIKEKQGITSAEKFSTYLRKLEKSEQISPEERKAYIGIYRLLHNVEKTDGAALGAVIKSGQEVTLDHLLTAVRTYRKGSMDTIINDEFGTLQSLNYEGENISDQLNTIFEEKYIKRQEPHNPGLDNSASAMNHLDQMDKEGFTDQLEYMNLLLREMKDEVTSEKLQKIQSEMARNQGYQGETVEGSMQLHSNEPVIWETMKDIPVEKLFDLLLQEDKLASADNAIYAEKIKEFREMCKNSDQAIRFLNEFKLPSNTTNLMLASNILSNGEIQIKKLLKRFEEKKVENPENSLKETDELSDTLIDKNSMVEAYEDLEQKAQSALEQVMREERIDSKKLAERKSMAQHMTFLKTLAKKEFYRIPLETKNGITNLNLTIVRGAAETGKVSVTVWSNTLGNVKAELSIKNEKLNGYISCDDRNGLDALQENVELLKWAAKEEGLGLRKLDYIIQKKQTEGFHYQPFEKEDNTATEKEDDAAADMERKLYRMAKALVQSVRAAESN